MEKKMRQGTLCATANTLDSIPRPLLDRMELIEMTGYSIEEKIEIAIRHLVPKQLNEHGLMADELEFPQPALKYLIEGYTRESGVRSLDRTCNLHKSEFRQR